jgi:hypothetical protein
MTFVPSDLVAAAEQLEARMRAGRWQLLVRARTAKVVTTYYRWLEDRRVQCRVIAKGKKPVTVYWFGDDGITEVEKIEPPLIDDHGAEFASVAELALAIVQHDDARAWYRAGKVKRA